VGLGTTHWLANHIDTTTGQGNHLRFVAESHGYRKVLAYPIALKTSQNMDTQNKGSVDFKLPGVPKCWHGGDANIAGTYTHAHITTHMTSKDMLMGRERERDSMHSVYYNSSKSAYKGI